MRIQLSLLEPNIKETQKNVKHGHSSHQIFWVLKNKLSSVRNLCLYKTALGPPW